MEYKQTLNLPQTTFPIKANLKAVEEEFLDFWDKNDVYHQIIQKSEIRDPKSEKKYILHDGPPYPNGDIHLGHALNKILKDIVVKYKSMAGFSAPYVPGWDCHGLPIETQLLKTMQDEGREARDDIIGFRNKCREYALKYVELQRKEFRRLGVLGEWAKPYLTIDHEYEADIIRLFGVLAEKGYIYRGLKPIHWCPNDQTALAEAEIEYEDDRSPSIYVKFQMTNVQCQMKDVIRHPNLPLDIPWYFVIWTTTPWTLPANVAVAAHPELEYVFLLVTNHEARDTNHEQVYIVAEGLVEDFIKRLELKDYKIIDKTRGKCLEGVMAKHPFIDREVMLVLDEYVTLEQGTGLVHIAPGHGEEDYKVGLKYKLPIVMPVKADGHFDDTVPEFLRGKHYDESNKLVTQRLQESGALLKLEFFKHPYPHCWRCKKPVIFRATEQWFVAVDHNGMRQKALQAISETKWYPGWGENRIRGMIETRPDWCISRQRAWGVPLPVLYCAQCHKPQMTGVFNEAIRKMVLERGTNGWFELEAEKILPAGTKCPECGGERFTKETDILDVWFESGSSHALLERTPGHRWPADLYLEGSDQHRGWFQSSLLIAIGYKDRAPYDAVLTHGFTIDEKGKKMSKSQGNVISPQDVVREYGADILRLWVASTDFRNDMAASANILKQVREAYTKIRNTCRFLLSNLGDFQTKDQRPKTIDLLEIDRWILLRLQRLIERVTKAYDEFEFHLVYHALYDFCVNDLSAFYLDMSKDRLYCGGRDSVERRSAQFALREILLTLIKLMAPVLSFTAEDIQRHAAGSQSPVASVFLLAMPKADDRYLDKKLEERWETVLKFRAAAYQKIEARRAAKEIGGSIDAQVELFASGTELAALRSVESLLPMALIVSRAILTEGEGEPRVSPAPGQKCRRCWLWSESVGQDEEHPTLCARCAGVVRSLPARS